MTNVNIRTINRLINYDKNSLGLIADSHDKIPFLTYDHETDSWHPFISNACIIKKFKKFNNKNLWILSDSDIISYVRYYKSVDKILEEAFSRIKMMSGIVYKIDSIKCLEIDPIDQFTASFRPLIVNESDLYGINYNLDSPTKNHKFSLFEKCKFEMYTMCASNTDRVEFVWNAK